MPRLNDVSVLLTTLMVATACSGKGDEEESVADYCGRYQQAICNCSDELGDDWEGNSCAEATSRNEAAQQLQDNGDFDGYDAAQSTCEEDYNALPADCTGEDVGEGEGEGEGEGAGCPDEVPEQYRNLWDCSASTCPSGALIYKYAVGESVAGDPNTIAVSEQYFMFTTSDWCTDTWEITGQQSELDPLNFNCSTCETAWEVEWNMTTGNQCSLMWGQLFAGRDSETVDGPFEGYLALETHGGLSEPIRNPDDNMLVVAEVREGSTRNGHADYGRGFAHPTSDIDAPPEAYDWVLTEALRSGCDRMVGESPSFDPRLNDSGEHEATAP